MHARWRRNLYPSRTPSGGISGLSLLLLLGFAGWVTACRAAVAGAPADPARPYTFYLGDWSRWEAEERLVPLEPETLAELPEGKPVRQAILSADGSTGVEIAYPEGRANRDPEDIWIIIYDIESGAERNRFHPPAPGIVVDLSPDGGQLLFQPEPAPTAPYPPVAAWYLLDTNNGEQLAHIQDADNACFRQRAYFDPAAQRIYCVVDPALTEAEGMEPVQLVAYDVESGDIIAETVLPKVLIGDLQNESDGQPVRAFLEPAVALSPDGRQMVIVHADAEMITLLDAQSLTVASTISLNRSSDLGDWFGLRPASALAKGPAEGIIRQAVFSAEGQFLYVFSQELWVEAEDAPTARGLWLVDLERERFVAEALLAYQIQWVRPAPDGTAYVFGTTDEDLLPFEIRMTSPSMLWRLDGHTLAVLAERPFTGYRYGRLVEGAAAVKVE